MIIEPLKLRQPLFLFGVYERGVPGKERIVLRVNQQTTLNQYALILGVRGRGNSIVPIADNFLWLGNILISVPGWVFVYTGTGTPGVSLEGHTRDPLQTIFWGRKTVILEDERIIPALCQMTLDIHSGDYNTQHLQEALVKDAEFEKVYQAELLKQLTPPE